MSGLAMDYVDREDTSRLLSEAYIDEPAIAPLYDDDAEKAALDRLEALTSHRLLGQDGHLDELDPRDMLDPSFGYGWSFVNAAFSYTRAGGNRFNREGRGAWYCAWDVETCLAEVGFHLTRELKNTGVTENRTAYVQLLAHVVGPMASLMEAGELPSLHQDPAIGYPAGQRLAAAIRAKGLAGVLYPSVRHAGGTCLAVLRPASILRVTRGASYLLSWSGGGGPDVSVL